MSNKKRKYIEGPSILEAMFELDKLYEGIKNAIPEDFIILDNKGQKLNTDRYIKTLNSFLHNAKDRTGHDGTGLYHIHHIWPKSLGGEDIDENTIVLTYSEHLKAHTILALDNPKCLEAQAAAADLFNSKDAGTTIAERRTIMKNMIRGLSLKNSEEGNPNYGNAWSDEQKEAQSERMSTKIIIEYDDGTTENTTIQVFAKAIGLTKLSARDIYRWISGERPIPKHLINDGIIAIKLLEPNKTRQTFKDQLKIIGINAKNGEEIGPFESVRKASEFIAEQRTNDISNYNLYKGGINKSYTKNKPGTINYKPGFGYYWITSDVSNQFKTAIKEYIKKS